MSNEIECVLQCEPEAYMDYLDPESYLPARATNDGTKKWYKCRKCGNIFCLDKIARRWQFSAETYTKLVESGQIKDYLR